MPTVIKNGKKIKYDYTKKGKAAAKKMRKSINRRKELVEVTNDYEPHESLGFISHCGNFIYLAGR